MAVCVDAVWSPQLSGAFTKCSIHICNTSGPIGKIKWICEHICLLCVDGQRILQERAEVIIDPGWCCVSALFCTFKDILSYFFSQSTWTFAPSRNAGKKHKLRCFTAVCCLAVEDWYLGAGTTLKPITLCAQPSRFPRSRSTSFSIMDEERKNKTAWIQTI